MTLQKFSSFPDEARLWIYGTDRPLTDEEQQMMIDTMEEFISGWSSHGRNVQGAVSVVADRFLMVAATVPDGDISGCGIDSSTDVIAEVADRLNVEWLPSLTTFYRDARGQVKGISRPDFREKVNEGTITRETPVFDLSLETVGALREKRFERPAGDSWHALVFRIPEAA